MNLALNARDAMPEGGRLELRVRRAKDEETAALGMEGQFAVVEVQDDGIGMSPATQARLFEPYFTTKQQEGTGLGLASVKAVVEASGGRIVVASQVGRGTTFRIFWPIAEEVRESASAMVTAARNGGTVLVAEDDPQVRGALADQLRRRGLTVLAAADGADALLVARRHRGRIDVLCSDAGMPGAPEGRRPDGIRVTHLVRGFREAHPEARVLLCAGVGASEMGIEEGVVDKIVPAPWSPEELARIIDDLVRRPAA
jgi:CheY-like chemotaxis protein